MISNEMLKQAATRSSAIYCQALENGYDSTKHHHFTKEFEAKIQKLRKRADHPIRFHIVQRIASIVIAILLGGSVLLTASPQARAAFFGWIKTTYETLFVYYFTGTSDKTNDSINYHLTSIPEGYELIYSDSSTDTHIFVYSNDTGELLTFQYTQNPDDTHWFVDTSDTTRKTAFVKKYPADFFLSENPEISNSIVWIAEDNTAFYLSAFLCEDDLIHFAESIKK